MTPTNRRRLGFDVHRCAALALRLDASGWVPTDDYYDPLRWLSAALSAATAVMTEKSVDDYAFPGFDEGRMDHAATTAQATTVRH